MNYSTGSRSVKSVKPYRTQNGHGTQKSGADFENWTQIQGLKNRMLVWRSVSMGLSFIALILISSKLYSLSKEVNFLQFIANDWLPKQNASTTTTSGAKMSSQAFHIENLRQDIELLIIELWSSRTTLILGMVFVFAYILSWGWMSYVIQETKVSTNVSLKSVLLLVVFAAVDIAASAGFVMVRIIMYAMKDHNFPRDMRQLSIISEHDQLAAFATLRLSVLQSSSGTTDIFISGLVAFLTSIRVYIVACAVAFYNRVRKEPYNFSLADVNKLRVEEEHDKHHPMPADDFVKPHNSNYVSSWSKTQSALDLWHGGAPDTSPKDTASHKDLGIGGGGNTGRKYSRSVTTTSVAGGDDDEVNADEFKIQAADMPLHMQRAALHGAIQACRLYTTEKHIAESVKQDFDQMFGPTWHCIVGRNWGSCVTHSKQCYIRILYRDFTILLYKSSV